MSTITMLAQPKEKFHNYMCIVRNTVGSANTFFVQPPPAISKFFFLKARGTALQCKL